MDSHFQTRFLANLNHLQELQEKVNFYEASHDFHNGMDAFIAYIEYVRNLNQPVTLITLYIRFAKYCLTNNDVLFARDLYKEAKILMGNYESEQISIPSDTNLLHNLPITNL